MKDKDKTKQNCWEVKKCGRELGGKNTDRDGVCPSSTETRLDGEHGGKNAGRACWVVAGTHCKGEVRGTYAKKYEDCSICDFYIKVRSEEVPFFHVTSYLLSKLEKD